MKEYEGKDVKIVFNTDSEKDPRRQRGHRGVITKVDGRFVYFLTDKGINMMLNEDTIVSIEELMGDAPRPS
tara:strand:+ start:115 stop:327 length:213 start_codon:yes stop_codon:yes gene_type:complete